MKRYIILIVLPIIGYIYDSCCPGGTSSYKLNWTAIDVQNVRIFENDYGRTDHDYLIDSINSYKAYGINIGFLDQYIVYQNYKAFSFIQYALAGECDDQFIIQDSIVEITITTLRDFDNEHREGQDASDCFKFIGYADTDELLHGANSINSRKFYGSKEGYPKKSFTIKMLKAPSLDSLVQFEISILLNNGNVLKDTTDIIGI